MVQDHMVMAQMREEAHDVVAVLTNTNIVDVPDIIGTMSAVMIPDTDTTLEECTATIEVREYRCVRMTIPIMDSCMRDAAMAQLRKRKNCFLKRYLSI